MVTRILFYCTAAVCLYLLWPMALPILVGMTLAYASEDLLEKILSRLPLRTLTHRYAAVASIAALSLTLFAIPVAVLIGSAIRDIAKFLSESNFANYFQNSGGSSDIRNFVAVWVSTKLGAHGLAFSIQEIADTINTWVLALSKSLASGLTSVLTETPKFLFHLNMIFLSWVVFTVTGKAMRTRLLPILIPFPRERQVLCEITGNIIRGLMVSTFLVAIIQAILVLFVLIIFQVPQAITLGFLAFFAAFIPVFGTGIILVPSAIFLFSQGQYLGAVITASSTLVVGLVDNLLRPLLLKNAVDLNMFWLFLALLGGLSQFGIAGTVIGPLFFALFSAFARTLETLTTDQETIEPPQS
jgi:predicted PurR-regulated permease PerM